MKRRFAVLAFCLICVHLCSSVANSSAADAKQLSLRWLGQSFFVLTTSAGTRVAFDPHAISEYGNPMISPDILLISHPHNDHNRREMLANALLALGRSEQASKQFGKLSGLEPENPKVWYGLGRTYEALSRHAFAQLRKAAAESSTSGHG